MTGRSITLPSFDLIDTGDDPMVFFVVLLTGIGGIVVLLTARLLRQFNWASKLSPGLLFAISHTLLLLGLLAFAPFYFWHSAGSPYGDVYPLFSCLPGYHISWFAGELGDLITPWAFGVFHRPAATVFLLVLLPGLVGIVTGGVQWWVIGWFFCRRPRCPFPQ